MEKDWDAIDALYQRAVSEQAKGAADKAAALYENVLNQDPEDHMGAALALAALKRRSPVKSRRPASGPTKAPDAYVSTLFDQIADRFDTILVDELGYAVPLMIADALEKVAPGPHENWLDLGCGTGLCAMALEDCTLHRIGVDIAPQMLEIAAELELYQELYRAEVVDFATQNPPERFYDLITAADVLPYIGDVEPLFSALSGCTHTGSLLAFSTETLHDSDATFAVGDHKRFAHSLAALQATLRRHTWEVLTTEQITVRTEEGEPVPGDLVLARRQ